MLGRVVALCRWLALLPRALVLIVLALARALAQTFGQWRSGGLQLRVVVERFLAFPQFQQREFVGVEDALKQLELLTARILAGSFAARLEGLREFGAFAGCGGDRDDEADGHGASSFVRLRKCHASTAASPPGNKRGSSKARTPLVSPGSGRRLLQHRIRLARACSGRGVR